MRPGGVSGPVGGRPGRGADALIFILFTLKSFILAGSKGVILYYKF